MPSMEVLYQLSYVGAASNPSGPAAHQVMLARRAERRGGPDLRRPGDGNYQLTEPASALLDASDPAEG